MTPLQPRSEPAISRSRRLAHVVFCALLLALSLVAYLVPYYDWDLVAYVGSAIALAEHDATQVQSQAYAAVRSEIPEVEYRDIVAGSGFRRDVASNPEHFQQQLRFYQIRPLYIRILASLHGMGFDYVNATRIVSGAAFAGIGILLFIWVRRYTGEWIASIGILLLLLVPVFFTSARTGSPDALSAFVVLLGTYELVERKRLLLGSALLLLSPFLRTDNAIFVVLLLAWIAMRQSSTSRRAIAAICISLSVVIVLGINRVEHSYSWSVLMANTDDPIVNPAEVNPAFSAIQYFTAFQDMIDEAREGSAVAFPFIAALALLSSRLPRTLRPLIIVVLLSWAAHIVLYPHIEDRYFVAGAALIGMSAIAAVLPEPSVESLPNA